MACLILLSSFKWKQKGWNIFWLFGSSMNRSYTKQQKYIFYCAESLPLCSFCLIVLTYEILHINCMNYLFVVLCKIYSLPNQTAKKNVSSLLFPFEWTKQNQACHIFSRVYELYRIALSVAQSQSMRRLRRLLVLADKIWNETNLQEIAQDWMF